MVGVALAIIPQFTNCGESASCAATAVAELVIGILLALSGVGALVLAAKRWGLLLGSAALILSVLAILFPTVITGTCEMPHMICNLALKPWSILLGAVGVALSLALLVAALLRGHGGSSQDPASPQDPASAPGAAPSQDAGSAQGDAQ